MSSQISPEPYGAYRPTGSERRTTPYSASQPTNRIARHKNNTNWALSIMMISLLALGLGMLFNVPWLVIPVLGLMVLAAFAMAIGFLQDIAQH